MKSPQKNARAERSARLAACAWLRPALLLVLAIPALQCSAAAVADEPSALVRMFTWWNEAMRTERGLTEEAFASHFTDDASIIVNNRVLARGIPEMVRHFRAIQAETQSVEIILPFQEEFREGNKLFTHHRIHALEDDRRRVTHVMGYALVSAGRIALINFVTHSEYPAEEPR